MDQPEYLQLEHRRADQTVQPELTDRMERWRLEQRDQQEQREQQRRRDGF
jgi:hypothetical protein